MKKIILLFVVSLAAYSCEAPKAKEKKLNPRSQLKLNIT